MTSDGGWSLDLSEPVLARALCHIDNAYWIPHVRVNGRVAQTHKTSQTAFRGFGGPQGMLVIEDILGRCAPLLGIDPVDLRRRNFYVDGQATPYGQPVRHPERVAAAWDQVLATGRGGRPPGRDRGVQRRPTSTPSAGSRVTPVKFGISFNFTAFNQAGALVHVYKDGSVLINHGGTEMGQGLHTKMIQVAATTLGVPLEQVRLAPTRTDKVPNTSATAASSGADLNGGAIKDACEQILGGSRSFAPAATSRWEDLVREAYFSRVQLWAAGFYRTEGIHWDSTAMRGHPFKYFAYGVAAAEVEVDGFTGAYRTRRVDIVHDVGDSLSPLVDLGQIEGGFVQGAGWLTLEDLRWDESDGPQPRPADHPGRQHLQAAELQRDARGAQRRAAAAGPRGRCRLRLEGRRRAAADAGVLRARGAARGRGRVRSTRHQRRPRVAGHARGGLLGDRAGPARRRPAPRRRRAPRRRTRPAGRRRPARCTRARSRPPTSRRRC